MSTQSYRSDLSGVVIPKHTKMPTEEQTRLILAAQAGDSEAMNTLVRANYRLVLKLVRNRWGGHGDIEDLLQEGVIALMDTIMKFKPEMGNKLSTYYFHWLNQRVGKAVVISNSQMGVPFNALGRYLSVVNRGDDPHNLDLERAVTVGSLDVPMEFHRSSGSSSETPLINVLPDQLIPTPEDQAVTQGEIRFVRHIVSRCLTEREREIVGKYYGLINGEPQSVASIAESSNPPVSKQRISQILKRSLDKLKSYAEVCDESRARFK